MQGVTQGMIEHERLGLTDLKLEYPLDRAKSPALQQTKNALEAAAACITHAAAAQAQGHRCQHLAYLYSLWTFRAALRTTSQIAYG